MTMPNGNGPEELHKVHPEMFVNKGPIAIACQRVRNQDGADLIAIRVWHTSGQNTYMVGVEYARIIADQLAEVSSGIVLASADELPKSPPS